MNTFKCKLLKGLKLCIPPHQIQIFLHKGALPWTPVGLSPWTPSGALFAGLDHTHGFLRSALDVSPSKQFLKVGSPAFVKYSQGFWIYLYFRIRHSFAHLRTILNKMASFGINIYRPFTSEHGQNITNITMI